MSKSICVLFNFCFNLLISVISFWFFILSLSLGTWLWRKGCESFGVEHPEIYDTGKLELTGVKLLNVGDCDFITFL